jgi:tRNA G10  N-methylase Trm11
MIVNIALRGADAGHHPMVVDPFCGVGTVLAEALLVGANVSGSDLSEVAIAHAKKNIEWLRHEYPIIAPLYANIFVGDATHLSQFMAVDSADVIVTEPFMGDNLDKKDIANLRPERVKNILRGLEKLYIGALKEWTHVLKKNGTIVMAMPAYDIGRAVMRVKNVVDRCESLGYTLFTGPIEYSRPQAVVRREFYVFKKK